MNIRLIAAVFAGLMLSGCSTWDDTLDMVGFGGSNQEAQPDSAPAAQSASAQTPTATQASAQAPSYSGPSPYSSNENWCRQISKAAGEEAAGEGFDSATQQRRADTTYQQCIAPSLPGGH